MKSLLIVPFLGLLALGSASRVLVVFPMPARSHYHLGEGLVQGLSQRGHHVTLIAPYKRSKPHQNVTEIIVPDKSKELFQAVPDNQAPDGKFNMRHMSPLAFLTFSSIAPMLLDNVMNYQPVKDLLRSNQKFDLVVGECFLTEGLLAGLSHRFKAPLVALATFMPNTWANEMVANPAPSAYVPDPILGFTDKMTFWERTLNFLYTTLSQTWHYAKHLPDQEAGMRKHFGNDIPPLREILKKTSMVLVNHHYSLAFPRPYLPNMIEIGGYHVKPPKPLPQDIKKFMDEAKDGVIYFSMGSNLQSSEFTNEKLEAFLKAFERLKQRVLWKFETERLANIMPKNVKVSKWLPQSDILAHPNVKLFITHAGLLSVTESVLRGVPIVGIPIFGDQPLNMKYVKRLELGVQLNYDELSATAVYDAIQEVLNNPKYTKNTKQRSALLKDLPMSQMDTAMYWLEYIIRHKGAPHLRSAAQDLAWYQLYLLDVFAFVGVTLFLFFYICRKCVCCIRRTLCGGNNKKVAQSKKKN